MASSKRPTYKVGTKLAPERKRRKSDLVVMWQTIWDVTVMVVKELWMTLARMCEFFHLWFISSERFEVQTWLEKHLPYVPEDFAESWRDGRLLAMLLNKLRPGCFPNATRLDPEYGLKNVYKVFDSLEIYFGIKPNVSVEEIVTCIDGSDAKLFEILLALKKLTDNQPEVQEEPETEHIENTEETTKQICIAKGTGLVIGFLRKTSNFVISCSVMSELDIVVEIKGPNSICSERITKRSPKKRRSVTSWACARHLTRSVSANEDCDGLVTEEENFDKRLIPFEYEIVGDEIRLSYKPKEKGRHKLTILWHGQHVSDSPYFVTIEDPSEIVGINNVIHLKSALKTTSDCEENEVLEKSRKISVRFQESGESEPEEPRKCSSKILSRRILRYIVRINGKDIPVNAENTESLATELLKMDYEFEMCPSFHRRNSWGFEGDAERKKSVIRQFCVDVNELDAQISLRRSRSLSLSPGSKKLLQKSGSFDSLSSTLNIVNEDVSESSEKFRENEADYAFINEEVEETERTYEITHNDVNKMHSHVNIEKEEFEFSSGLTKSKFVESLKENECSEEETGKISSLSTEQVDNSEGDLQCNNPSSSPGLKFNESNTDKMNKMSFNCQCSYMKFHYEGKENENTKTDIQTSKHLQTSINKKITIKSFKRTIDRNCNQNHSNSSKNRRIKRKTGNIPVQTFYRKATKTRDFIFLSPINTFKKHQGNDKKTFKRSSNVFENLSLKDTLKSKKEECQNEYDKLSNGSQVCPAESRNTLYLEQNSANGINDTLIFKEQCIRNTEQKNMSSNDFENLSLKDTSKSEKKECQNGSEKLSIGSQVYPAGSQNTLYLEQNSTNSVNDTLLFKEQCIRNTEQKKLPGANHTLSNIIHKEIKTKNIYRTTKDTVDEPKAKRLNLNPNLNSIPTPLPISKMETKDANINKTKPFQTSTPRPVKQFLINHCINVLPPASEVEAKHENIEGAKPLRTHTLKVIEQFNFKQFNPDPTIVTQNSISPIKLQIGQWESTLSAENQSGSSQKTCPPNTEQVSVKEKLAFWENAYKSEEKSLQQNASENRRRDFRENKKPRVSTEGNSDANRKDLHNAPSTGNKSTTLLPAVIENSETCNSINKETNVADKKQADEKISAELQLDSNKINRRSFSDPVMLETNIGATAIGETVIVGTEVPVNFSSQGISEKMYSSSSNDDNLESYDIDDSEDSGGDYLLHSTEDEYIDDEISQSASEYWGDMSIVKGFEEVGRCVNEYSILGEEFMQNYQQNKSYPEECKVFGIAIYYGHVAIKNRFQVYTGDAGFGNLSVSMQGFRQHDVSLISVAYVRNDIYEVTYQVMTAGYYLISIRWMDKEIPGSPFVCKVTF